jgi:WD40 repeat protein
LAWAGPLSYLSHVRFSPDGEHLLTIFKDEDVQVWNIVSREQIGLTISHGEDIKINYAIFSPDGKAVATAGEDGAIRIWDASTGEPLAAPLIHGSPANHIAYDAAGSRIVAGYDDGTARVWDVAPTTDSPDVIRLRSEVATALTLERDEARPLTESEWRDRKAQLSALQAH